VVTFLAFHLDHADIAALLARAVTDHATPVGSGTVTRTKRISADFPQGVPDQIRRAVTENANALGLTQREWEQ